jgi:hypothetical protein
LARQGQQWPLTTAHACLVSLILGCREWASRIDAEVVTGGVVPGGRLAAPTRAMHALVPGVGIEPTRPLRDPGF